MKTVISPLTTGQSGFEVYNLQLVLMLLVERNLLSATDTEILNELRCCEMGKQFFGDATTKLIISFCQQYDIETPSAPLVNEVVAARINLLFSELVPVKIFSGAIRHVSGRPLQYPGEISISLYLEVFRGWESLGTTPVTERGFFTLAYFGTAFDNGSKWVKAVATIAGQDYASSVSYSAGSDITIDIIVDSEEVPALSEFEEIEAALDMITPIIDIDIDDEQEMDFLSRETGEEQMLIMLVVEAYRWYERVGRWFEPQIGGHYRPLYFYGLFRQNIAVDLEIVLSQPIELLRRALLISITNYIIPSVPETELNDFLNGLFPAIIKELLNNPGEQDARRSATFYIIDHILTDVEKTTAFLQYYFGFTPTEEDPDFWVWLIGQDPDFGLYLPALAAALGIALLSYSISPVNNRLIDILRGIPGEDDPSLPVTDPSDPDPSLLAGFNVQDFLTVITHAREQYPDRFFYPDEVIGDDDEQRDADLADKIYRNFCAAYPDRSIGYQIENDPETPFTELKSSLSQFMTVNPSFDLRMVSIFDLQDSAQGYNFEGVGNPEAFIDEVGQMQRLMLLTTDYPIISALAGKGLTSSLHITQKALPEFLDEFTDQAGSVKAAASLHYAATSTVTYNMARALSLVPDNLFQFNTLNSDVTVTPNPPGEGLLRAAALAAPAADPYAEWRTLFGSLDSCYCTDCQSIFSPSAYFVDLLQFLRTNMKSVYTELTRRRPDIINLELSCANSNTPLPHIDIVNELLEDLASKSAQNGTYIMCARQTVADAAMQRAIPEYINTKEVSFLIKDPQNGNYTITVLSPYLQLKDAVYPWTQPYNFYKRQIDGLLELAEVKGYEISQRFSSQQLLDAWNDAGYITEYLGMAKKEYDLLINPVADSISYGFKVPAPPEPARIPDPKSRGTYINFSTTPAAADYWQKIIANRVDVLLQQTGLTYRALLELLDCYTLNPLSGTARKMTLKKNDPAVGDDTCDLSKLKIEGMDGACLNLLHRFVRLARTLGWTYYDLDKAMKAIGASNIDSTSFARLGRMVYIARTLNISVEDMNTFWQNVQQSPYRDYSSNEPKDIPDQYTRIFRNPVLSDLTADDYPFKVTPSSVPVDTGIIQNYLAGILHISESDLKLLSDDLFPGASTIVPSLTNLSAVYREAVMLKGLQITVEDWRFYKLWISQDDYFGNIPGGDVYHRKAGAFDNAYDTIRFITFVKDLKNTGFTTDQADYILRDKPSDAASDIARNKQLGTALSGLRAGLQKIYYTEYANPAGDQYSLLLQSMLTQIMGDLDAEKLINIAERVVTSDDPIYTTADKDFLNNEMAFFLPVGSDLKLADDTDPGYISLIAYRRNYIYSWLLYYTEHNYPANENSAALMKVLILVMDEDKATQLIDIVQRVTLEAPGYTDADRNFILNETFFFLPEGSELMLAKATDPDYISDIMARRSFVYLNAKFYIIESQVKPYIDSFLAKEFNMNTGIIQLLLSSCITVDPGDGSTVFGYDALLFPPFAKSTEELDRWKTAAVRGQFRVLLLLHKASLLTDAFGLDQTDMLYMWVFPGLSAIPSLNDFPQRNTADTLLVPPSVIPYRKWLDLLYWMRVRAFAGKEMPMLYENLSLFGPKADLLKAISTTFKISSDDLATLVDISLPGAPANQGVLNISYANNDYQTPHVYLRLIDCLEMQHEIPSPMSALHQIALACRKASRDSGAVTQTDVNNVRQAVKAQYDEQQWMSVMRPMNDKLRVERRDALLSYLLANPPNDYKGQWFTVSDIFDTLMVDVEMMDCMLTTRILLATNTIQLWVDRILLGLEKYQSRTFPVEWSRLKISPKDARQWQTWRKLYRVWEANRKIFIYPENWIEPELRDGKSPFFTELQKFLDQNDITNENVEDAYRTYLERLEEVAHLEIVAMCREAKQESEKIEDFEKDVLHVFGRTPSNPHIYYYRKRVAGEWTAWEKMGTQIDGDHFAAVIRRGRLFLYSVIITNDQEQSGGVSVPSGADVNMPPPPSRWKLELAWTELKNKTWTAKQIGKEPLYSTSASVETPTNIEQVQYYNDKKRLGTKQWYFNNFQEKQKKNFNFFCSTDSTGELRFSIRESVVSISNEKLYELLIATGLPLMEKKTFDSAIVTILEDKNNKLPKPAQKSIGDFVVKYNGIVAYKQSSIAPNFYSLLPGNHYEIADTRYHYTRATNVGYAHYPETNNMHLLQRAPDTDSGKPEGKYVVFPRQIPKSYTAPNRIPMPYFFYKDYDNSFFAEKLLIRKPLQVLLSPYATPGSLPGFTGSAYFNPDKTLGTVSITNGLSTPRPVINITGPSSLKYPVFTEILVPRYRFHDFYHDKVDDFMERLYLEGLEGLLNRFFITGLTDNIGFKGVYDPTSDVDGRYPHNRVDFEFEGAFSLYNWELFYHIPILIANKLSQNQRFEEARRWYHFVFDPTSGENQSPARFWKFPKFYEAAGSATNSSPASIMKDPNLQQNIDRWADDPFKPHLVARTRITAYMKNTVMKYLDNLIAWADNLFRTDTREAINEAMQLYVMAAKLLGRPPVTVPARATRETKTYNTLATGLNAFSNAMVKIESLLLPSGATTVKAVNGQLPLVTGSMFYFCFIPNDKLASYWSIVSDRLFKIRHCMNIDGIVRELALFAPPIDPALLVKAAASGLSLADALADMNAPLPIYRFNVLSQKATELAQEVKALGGQLLSAMEKKDAEILALLRSGQEIKVLQAATQVREIQINEAQAQIDGLQQQKLMTTQRRDYYQRLLGAGLNSQESMQLGLMQDNIPLSIAQGVMQTLSGVMYAIPQFTLGVFSFGATIGGLNVGALIGAGATAMGAAISVNSAKSSMAGVRAGFLRRQEEWQQQLTVAGAELTQVDKQIVAAQIRKSITETELKNHKLQVQNSQEMDEAMRNKYTNEDLYNWLIGQISFSYFQAYKLACDVAKRAEKSYRNELSLATSDFIQFGYWDSLHKGLLAGEQLAYDIKRMEASFLNLNKRTLELNKDISLAALDPAALMKLRAGSKDGCEIEIGEWLYDMDYPGQHMRRIKSVSISIPCAAGPYTTISCKLSLLSSKYRNSPNEPYPETATNFTYIYGNIQSIATSNAQNDSGMFELSFRDERYLPFEGAGAISKWKIDLPAAYAQFDYASIADVILHIKYTAIDNGALKGKAIEKITGLVTAITDGTGGLFSIFDARADFSAEWQMLFPPTGTGTMILTRLRERLPYLVQAGGAVSVAELQLYTDNGTLEVSINEGDIVEPEEFPDSDGSVYYKYSGPVNEDITNELSITIGAVEGILKPSDIKRAWLVLHYTVALPG